MSRRSVLIALSIATAALAACSNPTAPVAKPSLGVYQGSGTSSASTVTTQDDGVYQGSGTRSGQPSVTTMDGVYQGSGT